MTMRIDLEIGYMKFLGIFFLVAWASGQIFRWPEEFPVTLLDVAVGEWRLLGE